MGRIIIGGGTSGPTASRRRIFLDNEIGLDGCPAETERNADADPLEVFGTLTVVIRERTRVDEESGLPVWEWLPLLTGPAITWEKREEIDSKAGVTVVHLRTSLANTLGLGMIPETAMLKDDDGLRWDIVSTSVTPAVVSIQAKRIWREQVGERVAGAVG